MLINAEYVFVTGKVRIILLDVLVYRIYLLIFPYVFLSLFFSLCSFDIGSIYFKTFAILFLPFV